MYKLIWWLYLHHIHAPVMKPNPWYIRFPSLMHAHASWHMLPPRAYLPCWVRSPPTACVGPCHSCCWQTQSSAQRPLLGGSHSEPCRQHPELHLACNNPAENVRDIKPDINWTGIYQDRKHLQTEIVQFVHNLTFLLTYLWGTWCAHCTHISCAFQHNTIHEQDLNTKIYPQSDWCTFSLARMAREVDTSSLPSAWAMPVICPASLITWEHRRT